MQWFEYLIIAACILFVGSIIFLHFYLKKKGKSLAGDCSGNCNKCNGNCSSCGHKCNAHKNLEEYRNFIKNN